MFAAQGYEAALLLDVALTRTKGNVADKEAFMAALKAGNPKSVRGVLKFGNNNFPINDYLAFTVVKDARDRYTLKTIATPLKNHQDAYHALCPLK